MALKILRYYFTALVFLLALPCFAQFEIRNPGKPAADPMIMRKNNGEAACVDGRYYLFFTGGGPNEHSFIARSTKNFVDWKEEGVVFDGKGTWARSAYWAPEAYEIEGRYFLFFSAQNSDLPWTKEEHFNIGVAIADKPTGPYKLLMDRPIFEPGYPIIDANLFIDSDGTPYLTYSRCCYQHPVESELADLAKKNGWFDTIEESWVYGVQLKPDFTGIVGEPVLLLRPPVKLDDAQAEWESRSVTAKEINRRWTEGSTLCKRRGKYYLMYSGNNFAGDHYAVGYAISDKPLGPYTKAANNPILEKNTPKGGTVRGTGHNNFFFLPDQRTTYCVYHGRTQGDARRLFIDRMTLDAEGVLRVNGPTTAPQTVPIDTRRPPQNVVEPIITGRADPWIVKDGDRYLWCFADRDKGVSLFETDNPRKLGTKHLIWKAPDTGNVSQQIWAPELHHIGDRWYVYFAASNGDNATHRAYVLKSQTDDPLGKYDLVGPLDTGGCWAIDMTVLQHNNKLYAIWSGWKNHEDVQYLYIAPMSDPATISGERVQICRNDDYLWERVEETAETRGLNEAPEILKHNGRTFVIYSCGASWLQTYKLALLELTGDNPLDSAHWKKYSEPVFRGENFGRSFGVGHASFLLEEPEPLIVYHTKRSRRPGWERNVYVKTFHFDEKGFPVFEIR